MRFPAVRPGQALRICFGGGLLLTAFWIYAPNLIGNRSLDAVINARAIQILSPIDGVVTGAAPAAATLLQPGDLIVDIRNAAAEQTFVTQLRTEKQSLQERIASLEPLREQLEAQRDRMQHDLERTRTAAVSRLRIMEKEAEAEVRAAQAAAKEAEREVARKRWLLASGAVSQPALDSMINAADKARAEAERAQFVAERTRHDLKAAVSGILPDRPEFSFAVQRLDETATRSAELSAQLREQKSRLADLERVVPLEEARARERSTARLVSPIRAIVWRPATFAGGWVGANKPVTTLIDCADRVIQAKLPGRRFETVEPGTAAAVRVLGGGRDMRAIVVDRRGMGASEQNDRFAAPVPAIVRDEFLVTLALADPAGWGDGNAFCNVGRSVEVTFESPIGGFARMVETASRWIGMTARAEVSGPDGAKAETKDPASREHPPPPRQD
jgi:multidrug resistance efflux pump